MRLLRQMFEKLVEAPQYTPSHVRAVRNKEAEQDERLKRLERRAMSLGIRVDVAARRAPIDHG